MNLSQTFFVVKYDAIGQIILHICEHTVRTIHTHMGNFSKDYLRYTAEFISPAPVAQSVAFALPKTDCWEDLDRIPPWDNEIEMKGLWDTALQLVGDG